MEQLTVGDLFCGAGGSLEGFVRAGYRPVFAIDSCPAAIRVHGQRFGKKVSYCADLTALSVEELLSRFPSAKDLHVLIGGPPCQTFSSMGKRGRVAAKNEMSKRPKPSLAAGEKEEKQEDAHNDEEAKEEKEDARHSLFRHFFRFVGGLRPRYFVMENVRGIQTSVDSKGRSILSEIHLCAREMGYQIDSLQLDSSHYAVPQKRIRQFFFGWRSDAVPLELSRFPSGPTREHPWPVSRCLEPFERFVNESEMRQQYASLPPGMLRSLESRKRQLRIIRPELPSPTLMASYGSTKDLFVPCPADNPIGAKWRTLTPLEYARLQTFPDDWPWVGTRNEIYRMIGNAVPCNLAFFVAAFLPTPNGEQLPSEMTCSHRAPVPFEDA